MANLFTIMTQPSTTLLHGLLQVAEQAEAVQMK